MITQVSPSGDVSNQEELHTSTSTQVTRLRYTMKNLSDPHACQFTIEMTVLSNSGGAHSMRVSSILTTHSNIHADTVAHTEAIPVQEIANNLLSVCSPLGVQRYE